MSECGNPSRGRYVQGCRCDACREANRLYHRANQRKNLLIEVGRDVSGFVEAEPVRRKVRHLVSQGYTLREICRLSGVSRTTMSQLMGAHWRTGKPVKRCRRETKDAICAIKGRRNLRARTLVDAEVMAGNVREWAEWLTPLEIADALRIKRDTVYRLLHGQRRVLGETLYAYTVNAGRAAALVRERKGERGYVE